MSHQKLLFEQRASRGTARGADEVLARARNAAEPEMSADGETVLEADEQRGDGPRVDVLWEDVERPAPPEAGRWPGVAIAVAAAILVVVGVVVVADGNGGGVVTEPASVPVEADPVPSPSIAEPASSAAESDPVPPPSVADPEPPPDVSEVGPSPSVVDSLGYRWSRVPQDEAIFGGEFGTTAMFSVIAGGPGLVAVGVDGWVTPVDESAYEASAVWTSVDGITWSRVPHDEAIFGGGAGSETMLSVTTGGPGLVAVGGPIDRDGDAVVWTSVDGVAWSRVPRDESVFGGDGQQRMNTVTAGGPGLVAVGHDDEDAAVWTSVDGITWSRVPHDEAVFGGPRNLSMDKVIAAGPGLVAVGFSGNDSSGDAAVWTSVDGITWSRVPHDKAVFGGLRMFDVAVGGPGLVAVGDPGGHYRPGPGAVWTSVDGITWSRVPHDEALFGGAVRIRTVTAAEPGLVITGQENGVPALWTSVDGITWSRVPHDEAMSGVDEGFMSKVVATSAGLVAVGADNQVGAVWLATPEN